MRACFQSFGLPLALLMATTAAPPVAQDPVPAEPAVIENPSWSRPPMPEFPPRGLSMDSDGQVVLRCGFTDTGALRDCVIEQETPVEADFGAAALAATGTARLASSVVREAASGAQVRFPITFRIAR